MKKLLVLLAALCLLCTYALADTAITGSDPLETEDFTLSIGQGNKYETGIRAANTIYLTVYPFSSMGDEATNVNFVWSGAPYSATLDEVSASTADLWEEATAALEEQGFTVHSYEVQDPFQAWIGGAEAIALDSEMSMTYMNIDIMIYQRQFYVGEKGYVITVSAADEEKRTQVGAIATLMLSWK